MVGSPAVLQEVVAANTKLVQEKRYYPKSKLKFQRFINKKIDAIRYIQFYYILLNFLSWKLQRPQLVTNTRKVYSDLF